MNQPRIFFIQFWYDGMIQKIIIAKKKRNVLRVHIKIYGQLTSIPCLYYTTHKGQ